MELIGLASSGLLPWEMEGTGLFSSPCLEQEGYQESGFKLWREDVLFWLLLCIVAQKSPTDCGVQGLYGVISTPIFPSGVWSIHVGKKLADNYRFFFSSLGI
jgi:hypothetical protein